MRLPAAPMSDLTDRPVRYDLAESTCPPLRYGDLLTIAALADLDNRTAGYGTSQGDPELRALIAEGAGVKADDVLVTAGGGAGMFLLAFTLGGHTVVATPCFPPALAVHADATAVPLSFDQRYQLDVPGILAAVRPDTTLVSIASPQNPSGIRFTDEDLRALLDGLPERVVLLVDETYRETVYGDASTPASTASLSPRIVTCSSLSKSHGAPGLRIGWLTATDPGLYEDLRRAKFNSLISCSTIDERLAVRVLRSDALAARRKPLAVALDTLERWADRTDEIEVLRPDGGALCCVRVGGSVDLDRFAAALAERDVRLAPGPWFGDPARVFRLGFGHLAPDLFEEALRRLGEALSVS